MKPDSDDEDVEGSGSGKEFMSSGLRNGDDGDGGGDAPSE